MFKKSGLIAGAALLALSLGTSSAFADECSGRDHTGGTILGAIAGAAIGSAAGHGNAGAVVGGALIGGFAGNAISRDIDCNDRGRAERAYHDSFSGRVGRHYEWRGRERGYVMTTREYRRRGQVCRDFVQVVYRHGREIRREGTACRYRGGDWRIM